MAVFRPNNVILPLPATNLLRAPSSGEASLVDTEDKTPSATCYDLEQLLSTAQLPMEAFSLNSSLTDTDWLQNYNPAAAAAATASASGGGAACTGGREDQREENRNPNLLVNPVTIAPEHQSQPAQQSAQAAQSGPSPSDAASRLHLSELRSIANSGSEGTGYGGGGNPGTNGALSLARHSGYSTIAPRSLYPAGGMAVGVGGGPSAAGRHHSHHGQQELAACSPSFISSTTGPISPLPNGPAGIGRYQKPGYSYSCLIALALENSRQGMLPVSEIYGFMTTHFPYFRTAPDGWKNSVRHNLSLNKSFMKIENPAAATDGSTTRKGCLWGIHAEKKQKMREEICKWNRKDGINIKRSMAHPDLFEELEKGNGKNWPRGGGGGAQGPHHHHPHPHPHAHSQVHRHNPSAAGQSSGAGPMRTVTMSDLSVGQHHMYPQHHHQHLSMGPSASVSPAGGHDGVGMFASPGLGSTGLLSTAGMVPGSGAPSASSRHPAQGQLEDLSLPDMNFSQIMWDGLTGDIIDGGPLDESPTAFLNSPAISPTSSNSTEESRFRGLSGGSGPYGVCAPATPTDPAFAGHTPVGSAASTPIRSIPAS